jgi:DNA-binding transcriptional ArsR family regulator
MVVRIDDPRFDRIFRALANGTRRDILRRTLEGPVSISGLAETYAMSFAAVQKHVAALEAAGLIRKEAVGRERFVRASPAEIARARTCLEQLEGLWRHRLTALDGVLAVTSEKE